LVTKGITADKHKSIHVNVVMVSAKCEKCRNQDINVYILYKKNQKAPSSATLEKLELLTTLRNPKDETKITHNFLVELESQTFNIVFRSAGSCTVIKYISVYYFVCEKNTSSGVNLPETDAPANGFQRVDVNCSKNTLNPDNVRPYGLCSSTGRWNITSPCMCKEGYTLHTDGEGCIGKFCLFRYKNIV
jgi:hypothetical protein